jgi:Bacteriophage related domain of unknown function
MTTVTKSGVRHAFEALLNTFTAGGYVVTETQPFYAPQAGVGYLSGRLSAYQRTPMGIGAPTPEQVTGFYQINVNRPTAEGSDPADAIAARLVNLFDRGTALATETGQVLTVQQASERPAITAGDWLTVPVVVEYFGTE